MGKRTRSPKYPVFGLGEATERLKEFYAKEGRATVPRDTAVKVWGYTTTSGPALQTVATLIQYGLLDRIGGKNVKISDLGITIIFPKNNEEKDKAMQKAALNPSIFKELVEYYSDDIPSDDTLKAYLCRRKVPYTENAAKILIKSFRETLDLTNRHKVGYNIEDRDTSDEGSGRDEEGDREPKDKGRSTKMPDIGKNAFDQPIPLPDGSTAVLRMPRPMSQENFDFIEEFLKLIKPNIILKTQQIESGDEE